MQILFQHMCMCVHIFKVEVEKMCGENQSCGKSNYDFMWENQIEIRLWKSDYEFMGESLIMNLWRKV